MGKRQSDVDAAQEALRRVGRVPRLVLLFPIGPYQRGMGCAHRGKIRKGSRLCCSECHQSGYDDVLFLERVGLRNKAAAKIQFRPTVKKKARLAALLGR